jgi:hypothetical protein
MELGYINNVAARFWNAPYVGVRLGAALSEGTNLGTDFQSRYGSTSGYDGPHEFGHFWMRWFDYQETHCISAEQLLAIDTKYLLKELAAIESVFQRPTLYKNLAACGMNARFLFETIPNALFVRVKRDRFRLACSLYAGRIENNGDPSEWFSVRPPDFENLKTLTIPQQIVGQIASIENRLDEFFNACPEAAKLEVEYLEMLTNPERVLNALGKKLLDKGGRTIRRKGDFPLLSDPPLPDLDSEVLTMLRAACDAWPI